MTDGGRLINCDTCGTLVRLYGHNKVVSWTCEPCREGRTPTLLDPPERTENATTYNPTIAEVPY